MIPYNVERTKAALSTTIDHMIIIGGAARSWAIVELDGQGESNASADNQVGIYRISAAGTGAVPTAITPVTPLSPNMTGTTPALAFSGLCYGSLTGYATTQPTISGGPIHRMSVNANGGRPYWKCNVNFNNAMWMPGGNAFGATLVVRSIQGTSSFSLRTGIIEA